MDRLSDAYDYAIERTDTLEAVVSTDADPAPRAPVYSVSSLYDGRTAYDAVYEPVVR